MAFDIEAGLLLSLLRAGDQEVQRFFENPPDQKLMTSRRREYLFCLDYMRRFGALPDRSILFKRFPAFPKKKKPRHPLGHYMKEVRDRYAYRLIVKTVNDELSEKLSSPDFGSVEEARGILNALVMKLEQQVPTTQDASWSKTTESRVLAYDRAKRCQGMLGIPFGWPILDETVGGMQRGHTITLTGMMWMGKTWCMCVLAQRALAAGYRVMFVTKEMPKYEIMRRIDGLQFKLPYDRLRRGKLSSMQFFKYKHGMRKLHRNPSDLIVVGDDDFGQGLTVLSIVAKVNMHKPDILFLDGAHLLGDDRGEKQRVGKLYNVSQDIKRATRLLDIPWVQSVQQGEKDKLEMMQWSRAWAQDADEVIEVLGERDAKYRTLKLQKQREGRSAEELVNFDLDRMNFSSGGVPEKEEE